MMRQMRENTKWIMLVTALAFVALMVFEWGMDVTGQSAMGIGEIGRVNGESVYYEDYILTVRNLYEQVQQSQNEPITSQQNAEIEDQAFDQMVSQILVRQELERRGITVTDEEIRQAARFSPPPQMASEPAFLTDGAFDPAKYQSFLSQQAQVNPSFLLELESYYRDLIPRSKLIRQITSGIYLSDPLLWQRFRDQNETVEVRYVPLNPGTRIPDDAVEVTEQEIRSYYDEHEDDFDQPARASVRVVVLDKAPTPADSAAVVARADSLLAAVRGGEDFAEVAQRDSDDDQSGPEGGDLGVLPRGSTIPVFDSALYALPVGEPSGPLRTAAGYHVVRVDERWGQDSARASHILVQIERTDDSEIALLMMADSLEGLGESRSLADAAAELGLEARTAELTEEFAQVAGAGQIGEGADWAFNEAEPGDVSPVFENSRAFYALELVSVTPGGVLPIEDARSTIVQILTFQKKMARAVEEGRAVVEQARGGDGLPNAAEAAGLEVRGAGPFARNDFVPGLGRFNAAIGAAFGLRTPGEISDPVTTPDNAFIVELIGRTPADSTQWLAQKDAQRAQVSTMLQQQRIEQWLEGLRSVARIDDRRDEVLRQTEDAEAPRPQGGLGF